MKPSENLFLRLVEAIRADDRNTLFELRAKLPAIRDFVAENPSHELLNTELEAEELERLLDWLSSAPELDDMPEPVWDRSDAEEALERLANIEQKAELQAAELHDLWQAWSKGERSVGPDHWTDAWHAWLDGKPFSFLERLPRLEDDRAQATLIVVDRVRTTLQSFLDPRRDVNNLWIVALPNGSLQIEAPRRVVGLELFRTPCMALGFDRNEAAAIPCAVVYALENIPGLLEPLEDRWVETKLQLSLPTSRPKDEAPFVQARSRSVFRELA